MAFKLNMGNKPTDPNNFSQRDQKTMNASRATFDRNGKMAQIPGSDNPANYRKQSSGLLGFIGGAAGKAAMKVASKLTGRTAAKSGVKTLKDKPAYGIDQYSYAATKGKDALKRIKDGLK